MGRKTSAQEESKGPPTKKGKMNPVLSCLEYCFDFGDTNSRNPEPTHNTIPNFSEVRQDISEIKQDIQSSNLEKSISKEQCKKNIGHGRIHKNSDGNNVQGQENTSYSSFHNVENDLYDHLEPIMFCCQHDYEPDSIFQSQASNGRQPNYNTSEDQLAVAAQSAAEAFHTSLGVDFDSRQIDSKKDVIHIDVMISLPLGILFRENVGGCSVLRVLDGGNAFLSEKKVKSGDQLLAMNNMNCVGFKFDDLTHLVSKLPAKVIIKLSLLRYAGPIFPKLGINFSKSFDEIETSNVQSPPSTNSAKSSVFTSTFDKINKKSKEKHANSFSSKAKNDKHLTVQPPSDGSVLKNNLHYKYNTSHVISSRRFTSSYTHFPRRKDRV